MTQTALKSLKPGSVRIIPFGGCGEFGMNLTVYIIENHVYVVDCGIMFPDPSRLGVDSVIPSVDAWFRELGGVHAYIITHGHEDHIGSLPFIADRWPAPIYATPWTVGLIEKKFERRRITYPQPIHTVYPGDHVVDDFVDIEYIHVNHSIPHACALLIKTKNQKIFHTGDFKIDADPVGELPADLERISQIGSQGVDLLLADSTNAHQLGTCGSEKNVLDPMREIFEKTNGKVFITTFASNLWRIQSIVQVCVEHNRKLVVSGMGLLNSIGLARDLGMFNVPLGLVIDDTEAKHLPANKICVIATGSQGESRASVAKLATGEHRFLRVEDGDAVIFSSRTIPGNEKTVQTQMALLEKRGAHIYSIRTHKNIHVSGHAHRDELAEMVRRVKPKTFVPIHGTFSHLKSNSQIPEEIKVHCENILLVEDGSIIDLDSAKHTSISGSIPIDIEYVDSESSRVIDYQTLRERLRIGENGYAQIQGVFDSRQKKWIADLEFELMGLPVQEDELAALVKHTDRIQRNLTQSLEKANHSNLEEIEDQLRLAFRKVLTDLLRKKPVVLGKIFLIK